jgi:hypothetical protein
MNEMYALILTGSMGRERLRRSEASARHPSRSELRPTLRSPSNTSKSVSDQEPPEQETLARRKTSCMVVAQAQDVGVRKDVIATFLVRAL